MKYQNYKHYQLPITIDPLKYGKLLDQIGNKYIIQLNTKNMIILSQIDNDNYIKFFRNGELIFEFKDSKISDDTFIRKIQDIKFTFKDNKLVLTQLISVNGLVTIFETPNNPLPIN
jgi:hypothetical protein